MNRSSTSLLKVRHYSALPARCATAPTPVGMLVADVVTSSTLFEIFFSGVGQIESVIKFSACQQSCVGGDGGTPKLQTYFGVEVELERGLFAVTPKVPPR